VKSTLDLLKHLNKRIAMNNDTELDEARLERLILTAAASCVVAMIYLLLSTNAA
jgi:hypothetical protein